MRALTVKPGVKDSTSLDELKDPSPDAGAVLVAGVALGICGTDREIVAGLYGEAPPGHERLILGHESLGRVLEAPSGCGVSAGDLVVGIVRCPDPVPCPNCAVGEWDMCRNGLYTEHGIKGLDGFGAERWRVAPDRLVRVDPRLGVLGVLLEPASVVAKAWDECARIGARARWVPRKVLVTGAGPIGLLAALLGVQRKLEVHVFDRDADGPKPALVKDLGAHYHVGTLDALPDDFDVVLECTGAAPLVAGVPALTANDGIICLTGVSAAGKEREMDIGQLNRSMVLGNRVLFGSVNANRRHYEAGARALAQADAAWLGRLIARREPFERWRDALENREDDVKTVLEIAPS